MIRRRFFVLILCMGIAAEMLACRFTVREIGFSSLEQDLYSLVTIDESINPQNASWNEIRLRLQDSNIRLVMLNPTTDKAHPFVKKASEADITFPANLLVAPDGRILLLDRQDLRALVDVVLDSPLRARLRTDSPEIYSTVIWIESSDEAKNAMVASLIEKACDEISNLIPQMPKRIKRGPVALKISRNEFTIEKILLWALDVEEVPEEPVAYVIYGRGRLMGERISFDAIKENRLFRLMTMIGADCECGLDRKWMLGRQIPLLWPADVRRQLVDETGFDVDNPMILAEMSFILARQPNPDATGNVTFAPEVIDLNQLFPDDPDADDIPENIKRFWSKKLIIILVLGISIVFIGLFLFFKNRNS